MDYRFLTGAARSINYKIRRTGGPPPSKVGERFHFFRDKSTLCYPSASHSFPHVETTWATRPGYLNPDINHRGEQDGLQFAGYLGYQTRPSSDGKKLLHKCELGLIHPLL